MKITVERLWELRACTPQIRQFVALFGTEVEVTEDLCVQHASTFDWNWAALAFLSPYGHGEYVKAEASANEEYNKVTAPVREAYRKAVASANEAYRKAVASADEAYDKAVASVREAYDKAVASANEAYDKALASAFARAYLRN